MLLKINTANKEIRTFKTKNEVKNLYLIDLYHENLFANKNYRNYKFSNLSMLPLGVNDVLLCIEELKNIYCKIYFYQNKNDKNQIHFFKNINLYKVLFNNKIYIINSNDVEIL